MKYQITYNDDVLMFIISMVAAVSGCWLSVAVSGVIWLIIAFLTTLLPNFQMNICVFKFYLNATFITFPDLDLAVGQAQSAGCGGYGLVRGY